MATRPPVTDEWETVNDWQEESAEPARPERPPGYKFAESLHTDEQGKTLSFPHMAVPADSDAQAISAAAVALGLAPEVLPFLPRIAGGAAGASEGYKRGGIPGAAVGGVTGAVFPTATSIGAGAAEGADVAGLPGAVGGAVLGAALGGKGKQALGMAGKLFGSAKGAKDAATIAREVEAATTAAKVGRAVGPSAVDVIPGFDTTQLMQLKTAWSSPEGRATIREWVKTQAPDVQRQIKQFLLSNAMR